MTYDSVQKIALGRGNLTDAPVIAADIILGGELPVFIGGVSVNQFLALIDAVDRTCKGSVPLRDEYAATNADGVARFENVLISGDTPYVLEEVDTAIRYVVPATQTAPIEWKKVSTV